MLEYFKQVFCFVFFGNHIFIYDQNLNAKSFELIRDNESTFQSNNGILPVKVAYLTVIGYLICNVYSLYSVSM